jgi:predicted RNA-binding protein with PUA-like domain
LRRSVRDKHSRPAPGAARLLEGEPVADKIRGMGQWLVKEEPEHYSYDQLERDRKTVWAGVRNPLAQKHLRSIRRGDRIFYYHTGKEKAVVAIAKAATDAYPDPADATDKLFVVDVVPEQKLQRPVTLAEIKADTAFASFPLVRMARLSVMPVNDAEWTRIEKMSRLDQPSPARRPGRS